MLSLNLKILHSFFFNMATQEKKNKSLLVKPSPQAASLQFMSYTQWGN